MDVLKLEYNMKEAAVPLYLKFLNRGQGTKIYTWASLSLFSEIENNAIVFFRIFTSRGTETLSSLELVTTSADSGISMFLGSFLGEVGSRVCYLTWY